MDYFWIILIIAVASLTKGMTGFGFALVAFPPLLIFYSPKELIPVLILCNLLASLMIVFQKKKRKLVNTRFQSLIVFGALFTMVGVLTLNYISERALMVIMSIFFILLASLSLLGVKYSFKLTDLSYRIAGAILGFLTGSISISGPPLALFMNVAKVDNQVFREVFAWFSVATATIALAGYGLIGLLTLETIKMTMLFLPLLLAGSVIGKRLNQYASPALFQKISMVITLLSSVMILLK